MSVTGALKLGATFLSRFPAHPAPKVIYIPNPTIEEEAWALREAGLEIRLYRFFDRRTGGVDWEGMREDLQNAPHQSIILMHVGGSTPTGAELTAAQWRLITEVIKVRPSRHIHASRTAC
jgi:aspartate aminotransferase